MEVPVNRSGEIPKSGLPLEGSEAKENLTLPLDVTKIIFSGLSEEDLLSTIKVSTEWKKASLELSKNEYNSIEAFVNWIAPKLGEVQKAKLAEAMKGTTILESINLAKIKSSTLGLLQQVLSIVGGLNKEEISNLETLVKTEHKPSFFDTLLKLAIIEHDLEDASKINYYHDRVNAFKDISNRLTALGQYDKALEVALKAESLKAIKNAIEPVIISNNLKKASEMINKGLATPFRSILQYDFIFDMFQIFKKNNNWEQVFEMTSLLITENKLQKKLSSNILDVLKKGVELSESESDFNLKYPGFANLIATLSMKDNMDEDTLKTLPPSVHARILELRDQK